MQTTNPSFVTNWSAYGTSEYLLMAHPDKEVQDKVLTEKEWFYKSYGDNAAIYSQPHITVATFLGTPSLEQTLIYQFQQACNQQSAFLVTLNNYDSFYPHTIYLNVSDHQPFKQLVKQFKSIDKFYKSRNFPSVYFTKHPHLSLVRKLSAPTYSKAIHEYKQRNFYESFAVKQLILMKRGHQYGKCQTVAVFQLRPQHPSIQLKLNL